LSFNQLAISIVAQNLASAEFAKVASDAGAMASAISGSIVPMQASFNEVGASATEMGTKVEAAGTSFDEMRTHAEAMTVSLRTVAGGIRSFGMMGMELTTVAADFGVLDKETAKYMRGLMAVVTIVSTAARMYSFLTLMTSGHTAAVAVGTATETASTGATIAHTVAMNIRSAATWIATTAQNALNISHATFLALTGVGIAVIIAAAAAMTYFASQMNAATSSVNSFNSAAGGMSGGSRSIQRAGEAELYRRGIE
jgi:hypothetical protein